MLETPLVSITLVTWNSDQEVLNCLTSVEQQNYSRIEVILVDNASRDETVKLVEKHFPYVNIIRNEVNRGFSGGHNQAIRVSRGHFILLVNPDVILEKDYVTHMVEGAQIHPSIGMVTGKLWRSVTEQGSMIDTTGIILTRNQRHLDRGFNTLDRGQYDEPGLVFGVSGCCAFLKREMLEDISFEGEYLDEDFFVYREDVDLCWRAQWRGWKALYWPKALGFHKRRVYPENRKEVSPIINAHSVKNRFLLRIKNQPLRLILRFFLPTSWRDLQLLGYILLKEWSSIPAIFQTLKLFPRFLRKRQFVLGRKKVDIAYMKQWFYEEALPLSLISSKEG